MQCVIGREVSKRSAREPKTFDRCHSCTPRRCQTAGTGSRCRCRKHVDVSSLLQVAAEVDRCDSPSEQFRPGVNRATLARATASRGSKCSLEMYPNNSSSCFQVKRAQQPASSSVSHPTHQAATLPAPGLNPGLQLACAIVHRTASNLTEVPLYGLQQFCIGAASSNTSVLFRRWSRSPA